MNPQVTTRTAADCGSLAELRAEIDHIDEAIVRLIGQRFDYVRQVVRYKEHTAAGIEANDRRTSMMVDRRAWAEAEGLSPEVIETLFSHLVNYFISEEKKLIDCK